MEKKESLLSRRAILKGLGALVGLNAVSGIIGCSLFNLQGCSDSNVANIDARDGSVKNNIIHGGPSLKELAARKGLIYGASSDKNFLSTDGEFSASFAKECGILVPNNSLRWDGLRPTSSTFDFTNGDWLANFASQNNMLLYGHMLVWHEALPAWFAGTVNAQNAEQYLTDHITTVVGHYAGNIYSWNVVNEAIAPWHGLPNGMRNTPWYQFLGEDYIDIAFQTAAATDPSAMLVYNQNHLEYNFQGSNDFRTYTLSLLERLLSADIPVHALGMQAHLNWPGDGSFNASAFKTFLSDVASLGLKILITEMDVTDYNMPNDIFVRDEKVAEKYQKFLVTCLEEPAVIAVITWGLSDKYTWLSSFAPRPDGAPVRPLPLDKKFNRKLAWNAIARAFDKAPRR